MLIKNLIDDYISSKNINEKQNILSQIQKWVDVEKSELAEFDKVIRCNKCNKEFNISLSNTKEIYHQQRVCTYFDPLDIIGSEFAIATYRIKYAICPHCNEDTEYKRITIKTEDD